jgi:hypothetical protein
MANSMANLLVRLEVDTSEIMSVLGQGRAILAELNMIAWDMRNGRAYDKATARVVTARSCHV